LFADDITIAVQIAISSSRLECTVYFVWSTFS